MLDKSIFSKYLNKIEQSIKMPNIHNLEANIKVPNLNKKEEENTNTINSIVELYNEKQIEKREEILEDRPKYVMFITENALDEIIPNKTVSIHKAFGSHFIVATSEESDKYISYMQQRGEVYIGETIEGVSIYISYGKHRFIDANIDEKTFVYYIPSDTFEPIIDKKGDYVMEWMGQTAIKTKDLETEEVMLFNVLNSGIQVLFAESKEEFDSIVESFESTTSKKKLIDLIVKLIKSGKLEHENAEKNLKMINFQDFR